jgi:hypothetical protein
MVPNKFQVLAQKLGIRFRSSGNRAEEDEAELRLQRSASGGGNQIKQSAHVMSRLRNSLKPVCSCSAAA